MELNALLSSPVVLPSLPRAVALLMGELAHDEPNLRRVNQLFATDPALAALLLQLANSASFQSQGQITGISEALALLGPAQLRALVQAALPGTTSRSVPGVNMQQFWRYSLQTAKHARALAGIAHQDQVAAYTAGLLHGLGELHLHLADPETAQSLDMLVDPLNLRRGKLENRVLGYCYCGVSAGLAQHWQLPEAVVHAFNFQHAPFDNDTFEPLAGVLHLSIWRIRAREAGLNEKEMAVIFPDQVGLPLGLDIDMVLRQDPIDWSGRPDGDGASVR
jgi:HD-like signal output (HDOD) protein